MSNRTLACFSLLAALSLVRAQHASAQTLPPGAVGVPVKEDPGISSMWQFIDDSTFSVTRDFAEPGATRRMHKHPEFSYHVLVLLSGALRLTVEGEAPREMRPGEVVRIPAAAMHTFTNTSTVVATLVEVFGKPRAPAR